MFHCVKAVHGSGSPAYYSSWIGNHSSKCRNVMRTSAVFRKSVSRQYSTQNNNRSKINSSVLNRGDSTHNQRGRWIGLFLVLSAGLGLYLYPKKSSESITKYDSLSNEEAHALIYKEYTKGLVLHAIGVHEKALLHYEIAIEICSKTFGEKGDGLIGAILNQKGESLSALGQHEKAMKSFESALEISIRTKGELDVLTGLCYNNLGDTLSALGNHKEALKNYHLAANIRKKIVGEHDLDTASSVHSIAFSLAALGQHDEAVKYYQQTLEIRKQTVGRHEGTALCYYNMGVSLKNLNRYKEALDAYQKASELYGEKHEQTAVIYGNMGNIYFALEQSKQALEFHQKGLKILKDSLGDNDPRIAIFYHNIGLVLEDMGRHEESIQYFRKASRNRTGE